MIVHFPVCCVDQVVEHYSNRDGVAVSYVCTTDFNISDQPADVFYRASPHPEFGNRYFGLRFDHRDGLVYIFNADDVEMFTFGLVEDDVGNLQYSRSHHEYKSFDNGNMIDGGRNYIRHSGNAVIYVVCDGRMVPV